MCAGVKNDLALPKSSRKTADRGGSAAPRAMLKLKPRSDSNLIAALFCLPSCAERPIHLPTLPGLRSTPRARQEAREKDADQHQ